MKRVLRVFLPVALAAVSVLSCAPRGEKVIPASRLRAIYREMLLADQWLDDHPEALTKADTSLFYEAVFRKYGYDLADYQHTVSHYLADPRRYGRIVKALTRELEGEQHALSREWEAIQAAQHRADSIAAFFAAYRPASLHLLTEFMDKDYRRDTIVFGETSEGVRFPSGAVRRERYRGPEIIVPKEEEPSGGVPAPRLPDLERGELLPPRPDLI